MPALPTPLPPTPTPSIHSPVRQSSYQDLKNMMTEQPVAGPSHGWRPYPTPPRHELPPTPPVNEDDESHDRRAGSAPSSSIIFNEPNMPTRRIQPTRRPASAYPAQNDNEKPHMPYRKYTDPTPHTGRYDQPAHQLDVDLDAYSATEFDTEEGMDEREPTLSFVTTSTIDSTASTPSMGVTYGYRTESNDVDGKVKIRQTAGRSHAYSSAESSMASGAYSGYGYSDQIYHSHPPPLPHLPSNYTSAVEHVGLGISADFPQRNPPVESPSSNPPLSPSHSFTHRPWKRDMVNRLRSGSASSSISTASCSTTDSGPSSSRIPPPDNSFAYAFDVYNSPWQQPPRAEAIAMVDEGRENILNVEKIESMGGFGALTVDMIGSFAGVTHLLLPSCGSHIISFLPSLLDILAPSLVVLDISDNDLTFLPESLHNCASLEELNISGNPLRQVPTWVGDLIALRVLAVDDCGLQCLPAELAQLGGLHTLCARRNKLVSLPSWLCLLGHLEMLRVDNNPFAAEWIPIVTPILAGPSRPSGPSRKNSHHRHLSINNGIRSPPSMASLTSSLTASSLRDIPGSSSPIGDQSWATTPNSAAQSVYQLDSIAEDHPHSAPPTEHATQSKALRKMRSAGALLGSKNNSPTQTTFTNTPLPTNNLAPANASKFASLGSSEGRRAASVMGNYQNEQPQPASRLAAPGLSTSSSTKTGKWGFLRKMSMHRLKGDKDKSATMTASASANLKSLPPPPTMPQLQHTNTDPIPTLPSRPTINGTRSAMTLPTRSLIGPEAGEFGQISLESPPVSSATLPNTGLPSSTSLYSNTGGTTPVRGKRRSFLPIDLGPPSIEISIPLTSPFIPPLTGFDSLDRLPSATSEATIATMTASNSRPLVESPSGILEDRYAQGLESIKSYLRDLFDLSRPPIEPYGGFEVVSGQDSSCAASSAPSDNLGSPMSGMAGQSTFSTDVRRARRPTLDNQSSRTTSVVESEECEQTSLSGKKFKNDKSKRAKIIREIYETERTYVRGLGELVSIYVRPSCQPINPNKSNETVVPASERKIVFGGVESILSIHRDNFLPALEKAVKPLLEGQDDEEGSMSASTAHHVGEVFRTYIAYMKQYSTYINNFDNALSRMKTWSAPSSTPNTPAFTAKGGASPGISAAAVSVGMSAISSLSSGPDSVPISGNQMTSSQKKRVKTFLKRCKEHPKHSQINLESYLLLPIQRVPRYKLLLEDLAMCTPPRSDGVRDTLDDALNEIASLASLMNEEKREADSRLRLLSWQQRISKSGPSPLVQPHRRLILEGPLSLIRLVKKASAFVETDSSMTHGDNDQTLTLASKVVVPVEYIKPELVDRQVMLVLCSDLMVLATQRNEGWEGMVDLFNVLRMATLREPASIVHGNVLRVVDNKSIYYFNGASHENTIQWCRAINSARKR
ncbi:hypothetical protein I302_106815 [Kwoniella bestiolae CBS 10118]|uniref:DH domain-containing protein n=1 Tax=Kwoniella bestiolae CBS 10118 TaxID=1296100 RepID=A0A1B9G0C2_9TREE|nr:hypothetical protein I302_05919 [Kwoniella bestiolae CBS 10118]OCF24459.1 hypothetical protein I302_05919 [Kwoniella bestiolae CBS 10118]